MYEWSRVIFAKKSKFHGAGGPDTVLSPTMKLQAQCIFLIHFIFTKNYFLIQALYTT